MNDHASALFQHDGAELAIQPNGGKQIQVERAMPFPIVQHRKAPCRSRRTTENLGTDVNASKTIANSNRHGDTSFSRSQVCLDERIGARHVAWPHAIGNEHPCSTLSKS